MYPVLFHLGHLRLPTFGFLAAVGLMAALSLSMRSAPAAGLEPEVVGDTTLFAVVAAFVLSRLLLVVTNLHSFVAYPILLLMVPSLTGLGLLLTGVATAAYLRFRHIPLLPMLDAWAAPATVLWAFLSLGHLAEGSDPGLPSRAAWAVRIGADPDLQQPVGLFAALIALGLTAWLWRRLHAAHTAGSIGAAALVAVGVAQFLLTFLRQPYPYAPDAPHLWLDPIQFLALGMVAAGALLFARSTLSANRTHQRAASAAAIPAGDIR